MSAEQPRDKPTGDWTIEFDASIYGGGTVLKHPSGTIRQYFAVVWDGSEAEHLSVVTHDSAFQTFWEFATLLLCLLTWGDGFAGMAVTILGDNAGSLQNALSLKGRGPLLAIARELSWRQVRRGWTFHVAHLPSDHNRIADCLSRVADINDPAAWPRRSLSGAIAASPPRLHDIWRAAPS